MRKLLLPLCLLVAGCANEALLTVPDKAPQDMRVTWVRGTPAEVAHYCQAATRRLRALTGQQAVACTDALPARGTCTIYTTSEVLLDTLGDELAHCYLGAWHN